VGEEEELFEYVDEEEFAPPPPPPQPRQRPGRPPRSAPGPPRRPPAGPHRREAPPAPRKKRKGSILKAVGGMITVVVVFFLLNSSIATTYIPEVRRMVQQDLLEEQPRVVPESADFELKRVFSISVNHGSVSYSLQVPYPPEIPEAQELVSLTTSQPYNLVHGRMNWTGTLNTGESMTVTINYHFNVRVVKWDISSEDSGTVADVPSDMSIHLDDEWKINPSNPTIRNLAKEITAGKKNVYEKLEAIHLWVKHNIHYEKQRSWEPKDPIRTLNDRTGDCDDQSILFASLARSQGIPARIEMGALYDPIQRIWGGHAWMRAYIPLKGGGGEEVVIDPANEEFMVRDTYRFTEWISDGNPDHLRNYYTVWSLSYTMGTDYSSDMRYVPVTYSASKKYTTTAPPAAGEEAFKDSYKVPAFEFWAAAAAAAAVVLIRVHHRYKL